MAIPETISPRWSDLCVVAASGPSLTAAVAQGCRGLPVVAVQDAWRLLPFAQVLYGCDERWWDCHRGCPDFAGEKWSSHHASAPRGNSNNDKLACAERYGLHLVFGRNEEGFSRDPAVIHYGSTSGFQAINLAVHFIGLRGRIVLVGFDMRVKDGRRHFFGDHPPPLSNSTNFTEFAPKFERAAANLPAGLEIVNTTLDSALNCFPKMPLEDALASKREAA